ARLDARVRRRRAHARGRVAGSPSDARARISHARPTRARREAHSESRLSQGGLGISCATFERSIFVPGRCVPQHVSVPVLRRMHVAATPAITETASFTPQTR